MSVEYLSHGADVKVSVRAQNLVSAFKRAGLGVIDLIIDIKDINHNCSKLVNVEGVDFKSLLFDFLCEVIYLVDAKFFVFNHYKYLRIRKNGEFYSLEAKICGQDYRVLKTKTAVKSVTYNSMRVESFKEGAVIEFVLDL